MYAEDEKGVASTESTLEVNIPRSRSLNNKLNQWFLHKFQNISLLLRYLLGVF